MSNEQNIQATEGTTLHGVNNAYFIGIGGIGMSAIARYLKSKGIRVSGYDKTRTTLTGELEAEGIPVHYEDNPALAPRDADLVIYTPAVPGDHAELGFYQGNGYRVIKRSDALQAITQGSFNICVAGTHGKTTVSTMIAHILRHTGYGCNSFLGGIAVNYDTNFWSSDNDVCVVEADEYDRSFLKLSPDIAIITAMDADHLDIYGDEKSMQDAFIDFGNRIKNEGLLIGKFGLKRIKEIRSGRKLTYSLQNEAADIFAANIRMIEGGYVFDVHLPGAMIVDVDLRVGGMHNVENAVAAIAVADELEIDEQKIREAVAAFKGVKRRFEYIIPPRKQEKGAYAAPVMVDDYAHHPEELKALLTSIKSLFPQRTVTIIFQPHLFTRTRDFADEFAAVLSLANIVVLLPIYPAREQPIEGVTSELVLEKIEHKNKFIVKREDLLGWMKEHGKHLDKEFGEVIIMAGAGDIDALVEPVKKIIENA